MKTLALVLLLATTSLVQAQQLNQPKTIKLHNNATGESLGTITITGNTAYLHDKNGVHISTIVSNPDGSKTKFDPSGKVIDGSSIKVPEP